MATNNSLNQATVPCPVIYGGTGLASTTANQLLYSSSTSVIGGLTTANNGVLVTSAGGVPSISSTLPSAVQTNITQLGILNQNLTLQPDAGVNQRFILLNASGSYAGSFALQAGGGSASFGGGLIMYGASHATKPGWVTAGLSSAGSNFFTVNQQGIGGGTDVFTVSSVGAITGASFSPNTTSGIIGTTTNNNAAAGSVGEIISSTVLSGSAVATTNATKTEVTTISLTAGDWDVFGEVWSLPAAGTITSGFAAAINSANALPGTPSANTSYSTLNFTSAASMDNQLPLKPCRISLAGTTTIYLFSYMTFSVSTMGSYGTISARRVR